MAFIVLPWGWKCPDCQTHQCPYVEDPQICGGAFSLHSGNCESWAVEPENWKDVLDMDLRFAPHCCTCAYKRGYRQSSFDEGACQHCKFKNPAWCKENPQVLIEWLSEQEDCLSPRMKAWTARLPFNQENKMRVLLTLVNNVYLSSSILREEDPEFFVNLPEAQALKPGCKIVVKKAILALKGV